MIALTSNGEAYAWGDNRSGQLGVGRDEGSPAGVMSQSYEPLRVAGKVRKERHSSSSTDSIPAL